MRDDTKRSPAEADALLDALAAGESSDAQVEALCGLLAEDTPASRSLALRVRSTLMIKGWFQAANDTRFTKETAELIARLRQGSGRAFVLDTMQRVRDAAQPGERAANRPSIAKPSRRVPTHHRSAKRRAQTLPYLLVALASAACVFAAFQLGLLQPPGNRAKTGPSGPVEPQPTGVEVIAAINAHLGEATPLRPGDHLRTGDTIATSATGSVQLRYADGTSVTLGIAGELVLLPGEAPAGAKERSKGLLLRAGELEAKVTPQRADQPLVILTPHATVTVIGTRFSLRIRDSQTCLQVAEGSVELRQGTQRLLVEKDMLALADDSGLRKTSPSEGPHFEELASSLQVADMSGDGQWSVRLANEGPVLCQTNANCDSATLRLAPPRWKNGYLTGQYRVVQATDDAHHAAAWNVLTTRSVDTGVATSHPVPYMEENARNHYGTWVNLSVRFAVQDDGGLHMQCLPGWLEDMPASPHRIGTTGPETVDPRYPGFPPIKDVAMFGLAIECRKASVEFRKLRFYPGANLPELHPEALVRKKIDSQKGGGIDTKSVIASETGKWRLAETDEGLQILQVDNTSGPSALNLGVIPHRRVLLSGQVMALPTDRTEGIPALLAGDRSEVARGKDPLAFNELLLARYDHRVDSPCFLATPSDSSSARATLVSHFCMGDGYGIVERGKWHHFVAFIDSDYHGKMVEGHTYWPEGQPGSANWCMPAPTKWLISSHKPFTLRLYTNGQRLLWRNLKVVPY